MRRQIRVLPISQIVWDKSIYPRSTYNLFVASNYAKALKVNAKFPPIVVAVFKGNYLLVDGKHRLEAHKTCKQTHIQTEILKGLNKEEIYVEAVKRNINHGLQISSYEKTKIILKLQEMKYDLETIEEIISIPAAVITSYLAKRVTNTLNGQPVALKAPLRHLQGTIIQESKEDFEEDQRILGQRQSYLLDQIIRLLELDYMDITNPVIWQRLSIVQALLKQKMPKVKPKAKVKPKKKKSKKTKRRKKK